MKTFEENIARLEELSEKIRNPEIGIEDAISTFEEGIKLAKTLENEIEKIEGKIQILMNNPLDENNPAKAPAGKNSKEKDEKRSKSEKSEKKESKSAKSAKSEKASEETAKENTKEEAETGDDLDAGLEFDLFEEMTAP
ncbi:MAG: exodeoxyribonuclease VII small subunit, partial [Treponema sp.]|nr:exodeoxyribonuclease VII small subunit [Treponema sp.]